MLKLWRELLADVRAFWSEGLDAKVIILSALALVAVIAAAIIATALDDRVCVRYEQRYSPPTYMRVGDNMVPVGGGMRSVCTEYRESP